MPTLAILGVGAGISAYEANKASNNASAQLGLQNQLAQGQAGISNQLSQFAGGQIANSQPAVDQATKYYQTILNGNKGAVNAQLATPLAQQSQMYQGAITNVNNNTAPGAQRDMARANLVSQQVGQAGLLPMQAQQGAASSLNAIGQAGLNRATGAYGAASSAASGASNTSNSAYNMSMNALQPWTQFGSAAMSAYMPYLLGKAGQSSGTAGSGGSGGGGSAGGQGWGVPNPPNVPYTNPSFSGWGS